MRLASFTYFRAVAIVFIVAGHSYRVCGLHFESVWSSSLRNIITGGTSLFVFISGFMFHHVYYNRYAFKRFTLDKCRRVLVPYLVLGAIPVLLRVWTKQTGFDGYFLLNGVGIFQEYLVPVSKYFWTGRFLTAYWYVPFIMVTFLMSPLHLRFIRFKPTIQIMVIVALSSLSIFTHRPVRDLHVFQSVLYFLPVYLFGIFCSIHRARIYSLFHGKETFILLAVIGLAVIEFYSGGAGNYHKEAFVYGGLDLMYLQKILLCLFFMVFFHRWEGSSGYLANYLASTSFAIFFLHPLIVLGVRKIGVEGLASGRWTVYVLFVSLMLCLCMAAAGSLKRMLPNHSRMIIGY